MHHAAAVTLPQARLHPRQAPPAPGRRSSPLLSGSIIECESQTLAESCPLAGSPFGLSYRSNRQSGRLDRRNLEAPVTGATVPVGLRRVDVRLDITGQLIIQSLSPAAEEHNRRLEGAISQNRMRSFRLSPYLD